MAREIEEREFLGKRFITQQLPAMESTLLLRRILEGVLPALGQAVGGVIGDGKSLGQMLDAVQAKADLGGAFATLFHSLNEAETEKLIRRMLRATTVDGAPVMDTFDILFRGHVEEVFSVLRWVFEVNWGSFYERAVGALKKPAALPVKPPVKLSGLKGA